MHTLFKLKKFFIGVTLLGLVLVSALRAFVVNAQTALRGGSAPAGRVLQAATSCFVPNLVVQPAVVNSPADDLTFGVEVKNTCDARKATNIYVEYNDGRLLRWLTDTVPNTVVGQGIDAGDTQKYNFKVNVAGLSALAKSTNFYVRLQYYTDIRNLTGRTEQKSNPVTVQMKFITDDAPPSKECFELALSVTPQVVTQVNTDLSFTLRLKNGCGRPRNTGVVVAYNKDKLLSQLEADTVFTAGEIKNYKFNYNLLGVTGLTETTNFYAVAKYADANGTNSSTINQKSNVVPVKMQFAGVGSGDGGVGGGDVAGNVGSTDNASKLNTLGFGGFELFIGWILGLISGALKYTILWIVGPFIEAILSIHTYDDKFAQVIYPAWEIFRNLGNIFFILSIVAIGVATVFRISGWAVKDLLVKLIVGAILINFSLSIAQAILGIADTVQNQFLPNDTGAIREIVNHLFTADLFKGTPGNLGGFHGILEQIMNFFLAFGSFIAFLGIAALLTIRVLFVWILLMLSPLPYIAMVLPLSRSLSKQWWSEFTKWAFITPVMAFMLNLTALITVQTKASNILQSLANNDPSKTDGVVSGVMFAFASNAIPLGFLYMTLKAATAFGSGSAGFINKAAEKGMRAAFWPATATAGAIGAGVGAIGAGATKLGVGAAAAAKNVGALPFTAAALKYRQLGDKRQQRFDKGTAGTWDRISQGVSNVLSVGDYAKAKRERLQEERKVIAKRREEKIKETEQRVLSWKGLKVAGNEFKLNARGKTVGSVQRQIDKDREYQKVLTDVERKVLETKKENLAIEADRLHELDNKDYAKASRANIESVMDGLRQQIDEKTKLQEQAIASTNEHFEDQLKDIAADKTAAADRVKDLDNQIAAKRADLSTAEAASATSVQDLDKQIAAKQKQIDDARAAEKDPNNKSVVLPGPEVMAEWQDELRGLQKQRDTAAADKTAVAAAESDIAALEAEKSVALADQAKLDQEEKDLKEQQAQQVAQVKQSFDDEIETLSKGYGGLDDALKAAPGKEPVDVSTVEISSLGAAAEAELTKAFGQAKAEEVQSIRDRIGKYEVELDKDGKVVYEKDKDGNAVYETDEDGNFVLDAKGQRVRKKKMKLVGGVDKQIADDNDQREKAGVSVGQEVTADMIKESKARLLQSEDELRRATLPESYLATRNRRQAVKSADARAPLEDYDYETWLRAFKDAQARGDKNLALNLLQKMQSEGDYKDVLRRTGYSQTIEDSQRFMREKIGSLGFSEKEILDIMKESDDRIKSSAPDLGGMVKVDEATGKRKEADASAIGKLFDGAMAKGDGTLGSMWSKMGAPNVLSWDAKANGYVLSDFFKEGLSRLDPEDETAMVEFYRKLSAGGARQMTTDKGWLKDQPGAVEAIQKAVTEEIQKKYKDKNKGEEQAKRVYQMIQAKSGQYREASTAVNQYIKQVNRNQNQSASTAGIDDTTTI